MFTDSTPPRNQRGRNRLPARPCSPAMYSYLANSPLVSQITFANGVTTEMTTTNISSVPTGAKMGLTFTYDSKSRRIQKIVSTNSGSAYVPQSTNSFVYDGWNLLASLDTPSSTLVKSFTWGTDLSGSM